MTENDCVKEYENELWEQLNPYEMWIKDNEGALIHKKDEMMPSEPIVIFYEKNGSLSENANEEITAFFACNQHLQYAYADEDVIEDGKRVRPWFKPEMSPDTIESTNYFGSIFAIRKNILLNIIKDIRMDFLEKYNLEKENAPVIRVLFEEKDYDAYWLMTRYAAGHYEGGHIDKVLFHGTFEEKITRKIVHNYYDISEDILVSIIIPSKDNVDMLTKCLESIKKYSELKYEIIIVDNGSGEDNRNALEVLRTEYGFEYIYKEMDFNFSKMCNMGAYNAKGDVFIFLNDDITVATAGWDRIMASQAIRPLTGAVGAKLYYPDSNVIQHTGITNMGIGPAHKLCGVDDNRNISIYHARNLADYNVYAVTAAALAVTKEKFAEAGCFYEKLSVAYNDVKLCFDLYEHGYFNIVRNDVVLYHHESVSRGSDESKEKKARLLKEREILYSCHKESIKTDPFYSRHLVQERYDGEYNIGYLYPFEDNTKMSFVECIDAPNDSSASLVRKIMRKGPVCQLNIDKVSRTFDDVLVFDGWAGLTDIDECLYERHLLLRNNANKVYKISTFNKYREDAAGAMPEQKYNKLLGFTCHVPMNTIKIDDYTIGIMFTNRLNGKTIVYYKNSDEMKPVSIGDVI